MMIQKWWKKGLIGVAAISMLAACSDSSSSNGKEIDSNVSLEELVAKAKEEGVVNSVGMPDTWANWVETWEELGTEYSLKHADTDMSSAEELAKFEAEKDDATADIGDVGIAFGPIAKEKGLTLPYKTSYWDDIPEWAKDDEGHWIVGYTGTISFITDTNNVKNPPKSWEDLKNGDYQVSIGDALTANQAQFAILAAAMAFGGDESNIQPGIDFFAELAKQGRLQGDPSVANLEKGEIDVAILWDFNSLGYRSQIDESRFDVVIPAEGSVTSGYATVINKYAKNPYAAMLAREYILSDAGQENLAKGYARPIRENVELSAEVKALLLPSDMYTNAQPVKDQKKWEETTKQIPQLYQEQVLIHAK
ncbi:extracellular solute-binding protein [Metasolibacillus sp.]|uniref:ABC transporter substrate-binding protein n=1 Tax=Metasolibacillus sp. TaxID=2703680 RepID=UPI0025CBF3D5|nr:extracellular solute-binding protein [Metasolibacillus sp.]MCT6924728.1 extracellular solute-binding protein [Metasolibacillus sp.]MCT6940919.1 extracellular solute-binding protein [Metasolibacillus sp.]